MRQNHAIQGKQGNSIHLYRPRNLLHVLFLVFLFLCVHLVTVCYHIWIVRPYILSICFFFRTVVVSIYFLFRLIHSRSGSSNENQVNFLLFALFFRSLIHSSSVIPFAQIWEVLKCFRPKNDQMNVERTTNNAHCHRIVLDKMPPPTQRNYFQLKPHISTSWSNWTEPNQTEPNGMEWNGTAIEIINASFCFLST